ncbi:hypothetical protein WM15_28395 [Burkholderia ubonensis]|nr:hypothetical protein WM15_28395 [Burkholderia ubonensis]
MSTINQTIAFLEWLRKQRVWFLLAFLLSFLVAGLAVWKPSQPISAPMVSAIAALTTAILTLAGFVANTVLGLLKDKRDALRAQLEMEKLRLENEKLRRDLDQTDRRA